jgi:hypothetical protein
MLDNEPVPEIPEDSENPFDKIALRAMKRDKDYPTDDTPDKGIKQLRLF